MLIRIKTLGNNTAQRKTGEKYRLKIEQAISSGESIILDFEGVETVSSSFVDELIAKLFVNMGQDEFKLKVKLVNVNKLNTTLIKTTIKDRIQEAVL